MSPKNFLHSSVAVRRDDEDRTSNSRARRVHADHRVMVKLALLPVVEKVVAPTQASDVVEHAPQRELLCKISDGHGA
jgi:hypothetical protein